MTPFEVARAAGLDRVIDEAAALLRAHGVCIGASHQGDSYDVEGAIMKALGVKHVPPMVKNPDYYMSERQSAYYNTILDLFEDVIGTDDIVCWSDNDLHPDHIDAVLGLIAHRIRMA